jgi:hypothetical protein
MTPTSHLRRTYYAHADVRARMAEFLGGPRLAQASCVYITGNDDAPGMMMRQNSTARHAPRAPSGRAWTRASTWRVRCGTMTP